METGLIVGTLARGIVIGGREVEIDTDFRTSILFETMVCDRSMSHEEKLLETFELYMPNFHTSKADELKEAIDGILWFVRCGRDIRKSARSGQKTAPYHFIYDSPYLYASFMMAYHIDLEAARLHWWKFRALFDNLPDETPMKQAIYYRTCEVPRGASNEEKERIRKLKRYYALPDENVKNEAENTLDELLSSGGDISAYMKGLKEREKEA